MFCFFPLLAGLPLSGEAAIFETVSIPSSMNPVGSGARALGMGGAFIAIADDATAASWNPGGLIQLELPEISVVGESVVRRNDDHFSKKPAANSKGEISKNSLNYLSVAYPFSVKGYNMIVALNYQHLYNFDQNYNFSYGGSSIMTTGTVGVNADQKGDLSAYGLGYCVQITPKLSIGATLNLWADWLNNNGWSDNRRHEFQGTYIATGAPVSVTISDFNKYDFSGTNFNLGMLYNHNQNFTVGVVLKTPFTADLVRSSSLQSTTINPAPVPPITFSNGPTVTDETLRMPASYGIGFAWRFSDTFSAAVDLYRTEWDDYVLTSQNGRISPITGDPPVSSIDPTIQIRMGAEYLYLTEKYIIPFRGGLFYDQAPAEHSPDDYYGFAIGSGFVREPFVLDAAYQFRFGRDVGSVAMKELGYSKNVDEHIFYVSLIVHF